MTNERDESKWRDLGRRFKRFDPDRGSTKPSDWYILLYWLLYPFGLFKRVISAIVSKVKRKENEGTV